MTSCVFQNKTDLVNHLFAKLETPSPIKIQKTVYLLFAFYGATYGQLKTNPPTELETINYPRYLFKPNFEAWYYGPVDLDIHKLTQPRMPPISIGGGIGEQRGENKRVVFTLN